MRVSETVVQQVSQQANIVDVIDQFVALTKRGKNYFGYCPFHDERTPSFSVSPEKKIYKCFSCGRAGNVFSFFMEKDGLSFGESVKKVADLSGLSVEIDSNPTYQKEISPQQQLQRKLIEVHQLATDFYHQILLHTKEGEQALQYLKDRGFTDETIETFQLGVAPASRDLLVQLLKTKGYDEQTIRQSGLASSFQDALFDRFVDRIMFPLRNEKGEIIAFSGRIYKIASPEAVDKNFTEPKYLNSPETVIFNKGSFLFNLDLSRPMMRKTSECMLCEGFMDVIAVWQAGVKNAVASMGTSLTQEQIQLLQRIVDKVVIAFDGDEPGQKATDRAITILRQNNRFKIYVLPMIDNMDPDEMIQTKGAHFFMEHVAHEQETDFAFYKRYYRYHVPLDSQRSQLDYIDKLLKQLVHVKSGTERSMYLSELATEFHVSLESLTQDFQIHYRSEMKEQGRARVSQQYTPDVSIIGSNPKEQNQKNRAEKQLLKRLLTQADGQRILDETASTFTFTEEMLQTIYLLYQGFRKEHGFDAIQESFVNVLSDPLMRNQVAMLLVDDFDDDFGEQEVHDLIRVIKIEQLKDMQQIKKNTLAQVIKEGQDAEQVDLLIELQNINKQLQQLKQIRVRNK